jgi:hypothetical protein
MRPNRLEITISELIKEIFSHLNGQGEALKRLITEWNRLEIQKILIIFAALKKFRD